jgi:hypothetical protein
MIGFRLVGDEAVFLDQVACTTRSERARA